MMYKPLFLLLILDYSQASSIPLLSWTTSDNQEKLPVITAGKTKDITEVYGNYLKAMVQNKRVAIFFIQDELSVDDFNKYSSSFPHLQKVLKNEKYILFPSVSQKKDDITQLITSAQDNVERVDSSSLTDWKFKQPKDTPTKFIIFNLEPVSGAHSSGKSEILKQNDLLMHQIVKSVGEQVKDVCVVYTADKPAPMIADILLNGEMADNSLVTRHLLAKPSKNGTKIKTLFKTASVIMHVRGIELTRSKNKTELINAGASWVVNKSPSCSISITRTNTVGDYSDVTILIQFKNTTDEWYCDEIQVSGKYKKTSFATTYNCGQPAKRSDFAAAVYNSIVAPPGKSYSCYKLTFAEKVRDTGGNHTDGLILNGFQVETMCKGGKKGKTLQSFSTAYDCVGFFTIEILTGIFVTLVIMIGLWAGVAMMLGIQVQDRLDDPKGKTITVATATHD